MPLLTRPSGLDYEYHFAFCGAKILMRSGARPCLLTREDAPCIRAAAVHWIAEPEAHYAAYLLPDEQNIPPSCGWHPFRQFFAEETAMLAKRAKGLLLWHRSMRFCPACAAPLQDHATETARHCPRCGALHFPRIEPCIIVAVHRDGRILLAKHARRNTDVYTTLAGFMEHGESAEQAVAREVREEVGIEVQNIRYSCSQSWPFPDQLMLGFHADYKSGELRLQEEEIADAAWFSADSLPRTPPPGSTAHRLIQDYLKESSPAKSSVAK